MESVTAGLYCAQMPHHRLPSIYGVWPMDMSTDIAEEVSRGKRVLVELKNLRTSAEGQFHAMADPWSRLLQRTSLAACDALRSAMLHPQSTLVLLILQIGHGMLQGLCTTYVQGVAGAGKTYLNSLLAIFLVELCDIHVLWTGQMNQPQFEGAKELACFLPENNLQQKRYIRLPAKHCLETVLWPSPLLSDSFTWVA